MSKLLDLEKMSRATQTKIRMETGYRTTAALIKAAREEDALPRRPSKNDARLAFQYFGGIYNQLVQDEIDERRAAARERKNKKARERRAMQNKLVAKIANDQPNETYKEVYNAFKQNVGKSMVLNFVQTLRDGPASLLNKSYSIPLENFSAYWKKVQYDFWVNSELNIFESAFVDYDAGAHAIAKREVLDPGTVYLYFADEKIPTISVVQNFREGISNCMLTPIREWLQTKLDEAATKQTKSTYKTRLDIMTELEKEYIDGVPENAVADICNKLQIDISVEMPFSADKFVEGKSIRKRLKAFRFMNSRIDHVDHNALTRTDEWTDVSLDEMYKIQHALDKNNEFYTYKKSNGHTTTISSLSAQYRVINKFGEACRKFELETGLADCKIDDIDDRELSAFVREGTNYNETIDFKRRRAGVDIFHVDMKKAYANFKSCAFYGGFLGKITDFRLTDKIEGIGLYRITELSLAGCSEQFRQYNKKLKIYLSNNVYPSTELEMLSHYGATFKVVSGCWGVKPLDFEFSEEMINGELPVVGATHAEVNPDGSSLAEPIKRKGVSYYAKYVGVCDSHELEKTFWMKCGSKFFSVVQQKCGANIAKWYTNHEAKFGYTKKHNYHLGHVSAFITSYQRMCVIEQLMAMDYSQIIRVCVDGIYFDGEKVPLCNVFRYKDGINFNNIAANSYVSRATEQPLHEVIKDDDGGYSMPREFNKKRDHFTKELHLGEGGCGKTHMNCNDKGLMRPLFVAPSWKLAVSKKRECGIDSTVWARALSDDPEKIKSIRERANVLIVDEVSMLSEPQKQKFFALYPDMKIIMCGDLGYQLPCIDGKAMSTTGFDNIVKHATDFRCKDPALKIIKNNLREMIECGRGKHEINKYAVDAFRALGRCITADQLKERYTVDDMILSGTNEIKDFYTSMFKGKFDREKYYVTENNRLYNNGEIVIGAAPEMCKSEVRHCFTTHSIQGETATHNLFIDSARMFEARMFYTAVSRAKTLSQIFIILPTQ